MNSYSRVHPRDRGAVMITRRRNKHFANTAHRRNEHSATLSPHYPKGDSHEYFTS